MCMHAKSLQLHPTLCDPMDCSPPGPFRCLCPQDFPGKNIGVGCWHFHLQRIFSTQGLNPGVLHCRQILYHLSHQGSPLTLNPFSFFYSLLNIVFHPLYFSFPVHSIFFFSLSFIHLNVSQSGNFLTMVYSVYKE